LEPAATGGGEMSEKKGLSSTLRNLKVCEESIPPPRLLPLARPASD
jgi:hypothetical protein